MKKKLIFVSCYLTTGIKPTTKEPWFRMSSQENRKLKTSFDIGNLSYSKVVKGGTQPSQVIHTWFLNDMTQSSYEDLLLLNDSSNEFKLHVPRNDSRKAILLTLEEYSDLGKSDVSEELDMSEQPSLQ